MWSAREYVGGLETAGFYETEVSFLSSIASFKTKKVYISVNLVALLHKISVAGALGGFAVTILQICNPLNRCLFPPQLTISSSLMTPLATESDSRGEPAEP